MLRSYIASAQVVISANLSAQVALASARQPFAQAAQAKVRRLNGTEHGSYRRSNSVSASFFATRVARAGCVLYDGQRFLAA